MLRRRTAKTTTAKGADALTAAGVGERMRDDGRRGGALVALSGAVVGPRGKVPWLRTETVLRRQGKVTPGLSIDHLKRLIDDAIEEGKSLGKDALQEQLADLFVLVFEVMDVREGRGERWLAENALLHLTPRFPETCAALVPLIPEYNSWRMLNQLHLLALDAQNEAPFANLATAVEDCYIKQLQEDLAAVEASSAKDETPASARVSLAGKWAPSVKSRYDRYSQLGQILARRLSADDPRLPSGLRDKPSTDEEKKGVSAAERLYRKTLSRLRAAIDVPEVKMAGKRWREIDPAHVPSICARTKRAALLNRTLSRGQMTSQQRSEDPDRVECASLFLRAAENTVKGVAGGDKVHGKRNQVHNLVSYYMTAWNKPHRSEEDPMLEAQWASLVRHIAEQGTLPRCVPLVDVSGSMTGTPMEVAIALGILLAELAPEPWTNRCITFETNPRWVDLSDCKTLREKVIKLQEAPWGGSTDFAKALELILDTCTEQRVTEENFPQNLFVFSDMQFDAASVRKLAPFQDRDGNDVRSRFTERFGQAPHVVYWNLAVSGTPNYQADADADGVSLMSGFSQEVLKEFLEEGELHSQAEVTPWERLCAKLELERYDPVRKVCAEVGEGALKGYTCEREATPCEDDDGADGSAAGAAAGGGGGGGGAARVEDDDNF